MKKTFLYLIGAIAVLAGCAREVAVNNEAEQSTERLVTIQAQLAPYSKTTVSVADGHGTYAWQDNEIIQVVQEGVDPSDFSVSDPENGYFTGALTDGKDILGAVSPASALATLGDEGEYLYFINFSGDYNYEDGTNAIMISGAPETIEQEAGTLYKFQFKHAAALVASKWVNVPVGTAAFRFTTDKPIVGQFDLESFTGNDFTVNGTADGTNNVATVTLNEPVSEANQTLEFFVPIPTGTYGKIDIALLDNLGNVIPGTHKSQTRTFSPERSDLIRIPIVTLAAAEIVNAYVKVTDNSEISSGDYLIVYEGGTVKSNTYGAQVLTGLTNETKPVGTCADVTITDNKIDIDTYGAYNIVATNVGDNYYTLKLGEIYLAMKSDATNLYGFTDEDIAKLTGETAPMQPKWTLTSSQVTNALYTTRFINWNPNVQSGTANPRFAAYKSNSNMEPIALYKKTSGAVSSLIDPALSFGETTAFTVTLNEVENFTAPTLVNTYGVPVTWTSSNEELVIVEDGELLFEDNATGTATITASFDGSSVFSASSASYTITVTPGAIQGIGALKDYIDENDGAEVTVNVQFTDAVVTYANSGKAYIQDSSAGIFIYAGGTDLTAGDQFSGKAKVTVKLTTGQHQIVAVSDETPLKDLVTATGVDYSAEELTVAEAVSDEGLELYENMWVIISEETKIVVSGIRKYLQDADGKQIQLWTLSGSDASLDDLNADDVILSAKGYPMNYNSKYPELVIVNTNDVVVKQVPTLAADPTSLSFTKDGGSETITLTPTNFSGTPTYAVTGNTNSDVFSTSVSGNVVTVTTAANSQAAQTGTLTITANYGTETAYATVELSQDSGKAGTTTWTLVTNVSSLSAGDEIVIANTDATYAIGPQKNTANRTAKSVTASNDKKTLTALDDEVVSFILEASGTNWMFKSTSSEKYLYANSSSSNNINEAEANTAGDNGKWSVTIGTAGAATITAQGANTRKLMRYNPNNNSPLFACYVTTTNTGTLVAIYKKATSGNGGEEEITVARPTFNPATGSTISAGSTITISAESEATVYYTTDGTNPTTASTNGTTVTVPSGITTLTVKAIAEKNGVTSEVAEATYTVNSGSGTTTWNLVTNASSLAVGDELVIVYSEGKIAGDISKDFMASVDVDISDNSISSLPNEAVVLTLGGKSGAWTLSNSSGKLLGATAAKKVAWGSGTTTWSISISDNNATISNGTSSYGKILYNVSSPRFTTYTSNTSESMVLPQLYRKTVSSN